MKKTAQCHYRTTSICINHLFTPDDLRALSVDPAMFPACANYARRHYPRMSMARLAS